MDPVSIKHRAYRYSASAGINRTESGIIFSIGVYYYFGKVAVSFKEILQAGLTNIHNDYDAKTMCYITTMGITF